MAILQAVRSNRHKEVLLLILVAFSSWISVLAVDDDNSTADENSDALVEAHAWAYHPDEVQVGPWTSHVFAGVRMTIQLALEGTNVSLDERIRVVPSTTLCGQIGSGTSASSLINFPLPGDPLSDFNISVEALDNVGVLLEPEANLTNATSVPTLVWKNLAIVEIGIFRICFCDAQSNQCSSDNHFKKQAGEIVVMGPTDGQAFACEAGWPCTLGPLLGHVNNGNRLRVMTSCYPPVEMYGFLPRSIGQASESNHSSDLSLVVGDPAISQPSSTREFSWGLAEVISLGIAYEICWCAGRYEGCDRTENFLVRAGSITVPGPSKPVEVLCAAGRLCHFALSSGTGVALGDGDRVMVLPHCRGGVNVTVENWPNDGISDPATSDGHDFLWDIAWSNLTGIPTGTNRLCWCSRLRSCLDSDDFRFDAGTITVAGPRGGQTWVCTLGQRCRIIDIEGTTLAVDDHYLPLRQCGISGNGNVTGFSNSRVLDDYVLPTPSSNSSNAGLEWSLVTAHPATYHLCWAPSWQRPSQKSCDALGWIRRKSGSALTCAETKFSGGGCGADSIANARATCSNKGARLCLPHEIMQGETRGTSCESESATWTAQSCGLGRHVLAGMSQTAESNLCKQAEVDITVWIKQTTLAPVACCADAESIESGYEDWFNDWQHYVVDAGIVTVRGPTVQDNYCAVGDTCIVMSVGVLLNQGTDFLMVVSTDYTCGTATAVPLSQYFSSSKANATVKSSSEEEYSLGTSSQSGIFRLCWCSLGQTACFQNVDFNVDAGLLSVGGISEQNFKCIYAVNCTVWLNGTNLGGEDTVLLIPASVTCSQATLAHIVDAKASINPAVTHADDVANNAFKRFHVGSILQHGDARICYCIRFGNRLCQDNSGLVLSYFSLSAGTINVFGPFLNTTLTNGRAGVPYSVELAGEELSILNRISLQKVDGGPLCGELGSNISDVAVTLPDQVPTSVSFLGNQQAWYGITVSHASSFRVCWCVGSMPCAHASDYSLQAAWVFVEGVEPSFIYGDQIVGKPFDLTLHGYALSPTDRVAIVPTSVISHCGAAGTATAMSGLVQGASGAPTAKDIAGVLGAEEMWRDVAIMVVGSYLICWCGDSNCVLDVNFGTQAARLDVTGPNTTNFENIVAGKTFEIRLFGSSLRDDDRISIVDSSVECGTVQANTLASTLVFNATNKTISNSTLGEPESVSSDGQVWRGLMIRWKGTYKLCWAGNYSSSRRCAVVNEDSSCASYESAYYPFHVGNIEVVYGNASIIGETQIARCDSLDLMAFSPSPAVGNDSALDAFAATWACSPRGELCDTLSPYLESQSGQLHIVVSAKLMADMLDRAEWVAQGLGLDTPVQRFTVSVSMIDTHNVTRWASLPLSVSNLVPLVQGFPPAVNTTIADELHLQVYIQYPGGITCSAPTHEPIQSITWHSVHDSGIDLTAIGSSSSMYDLLVLSTQMAVLGLGSHNISARVDFGSTFPAQEVFFSVHLRPAPVPTISLLAPATMRLGCPAIFRASSLEDTFYAAPSLSYNWSCPNCTSALGEASGEWHVIETGELPVGVHSPAMVVNVSSINGASIISDVDLSVISGGASWPYLPLPLPQAVGRGSQVTCGIVTGAVVNCTPPSNATWSLVQLPGNIETALTTERIEFNIGSQLAVSLQATFSTSSLVAGTQYRCVLRASGSIVHNTNAMLVAFPPSIGRIIVAPTVGIALSTQFTLTSEDWVSDQLPLIYAFLAIPVSSHNGLNYSTPIDARYFLRGWDNAEVFSCVLGQSGNLDVAVKVQDVLGALAMASAPVVVQEPTSPISFDVKAISQWPPDARSLTTASVQLAIATSGGNVSVTDLAAVSPLLTGLWNASQLASLGTFHQNDLALRGWALVHTLYLAGAHGPDFAQIYTAARVMERSLAQAAALTTMGTRQTIEMETATRFLSAASIVSSSMASLTNTGLTSSMQEAEEIMSLLRDFDQHMGEAIILRIRRTVDASDGESSKWEHAIGGEMSMYVGQILRAAAIAGTTYSHGLRLQVATTAGGRRLASVTATSSTLASTTTTGDMTTSIAPATTTTPGTALTYVETQEAMMRSCIPDTVAVQLTFWNRISPLSAMPFSDQVSFEGTLTGLKANWSLGGGASDPHVATVRLWLCPEGLQQFPGITVTFAISRGQAGFVDTVTNGTMLQTYHINISWQCAQWDASLAKWRAASDMLSASDSSSIDCVSRLPASHGPMYLAAFPAARTTLYSEELIPTQENKEEGVRFKASNLWPLLVTAIVLQVPLIILCILDAWDPPAKSRDDTSGTIVAGGRSQPPRATCVLIPSLSLFEGLWRLRECKCCTWCCCRGRRRHKIQPLQKLIAIESRSFVPSLEDEAATFKTEPALRNDVFEATQQALLELKEARAAKDTGVQRHGYSLCCGCCRRNAQVALQRKLLMKSLVAYRNLMLNSLQHKALVKAGVQAGNSPRHSHVHLVNLKKLDSVCDIGANPEDEPFVLRVAHHVQEYLSEAGNSSDGIRLSAAEELSVKCCQRALSHTMYHLAQDREQSTKSGSLKPQPFYAPPCAVRLQLTSIERIKLPDKNAALSVLEKKRIASNIDLQKAKSRTKVLQVTPESESQMKALEVRPESSMNPMESMGGVSMNANTSLVLAKNGTARTVNGPAPLEATPGLMGIIPEPTKAWEDTSQEEPPPLQDDDDLEGRQKFLTECDYYMWANGKTLFIHRAETLMTNPQKAPMPLDQSLSSHETTWTYDLERDVTELALCPGDDRFVVLNLRGGRSFRWQIDGEIRAWVESLNAKIIAAAMHINDILHCWQPHMQGDDSSCFFYHVAELPPAACNIFFDTVAGRVAPGLLWYSHGGAVISFAMAPQNMSLQEAEWSIAMTGATPRMDDAKAKHQALGAYLADIVSFRHLTISGPAVASATSAANQMSMEVQQRSRFCLELIMKNGTRLRICFGSRFQRLSCQCSINRLRQLVDPRSSIITVGIQTVRPDLFGAVAARGAHVRDQPAALSDSPSPRMNDLDLPFLVAPPWRGLRGILEVKIFSATKLGLVDADGGQSALALAAGKLGRKKQMQAMVAAKQPMPCPKLCAYFATQAPPQRMECRKTPDLPERTTNPIWNNTWIFTVEYNEDDDPPADIRLEIYNVDGRNEYLGEVHVPFPLENCTVQYHMDLKKNPAKMQDQSKDVGGTVSFQVTMKVEETDGLRPTTPGASVPKHIPVMPDDFKCVCGTLGVEIVRAIGLRTADLLSSDPYCAVLVPSAPRQMSTWRTTTRFGTLSPVWREVHEFFINWPKSDLDSSIEVKMEIWDHDAVSSDEFLGEISFSLPYADGENLIDMEVQPNHKKGPNTVKGRLQARIWFENQFKAAEAHSQRPLDSYERAFCDYFGSEHVDDQLARTIAPPLMFFHLSIKRIVVSQFRDAWRRATYGLLASKALRGQKTRVECYLELMSALCFGIGLAAVLLHFWYDDDLWKGTWLSDLLDDTVLSAVIGGVGAALFAIDPANVLANFLWHRPASLVSVGRAGLGGEGWVSSPAQCDGVALLISLLGIGAFLALEPEEKAVDRLPLAAGILLVTWLFILPLFRGLRLTVMLLHARVSRKHDWIIRLFPSLMTAHGALLQRLSSQFL